MIYFSWNLLFLLFFLLFSIVYKITDFGSSRELLGEDRSKALYGTEEYLVSDVFPGSCFLREGGESG